MVPPEPPSKTKTTPFISGVLVAFFLISLWSYTHPPQTQTQTQHDPTTFHDRRPRLSKNTQFSKPGPIKLVMVTGSSQPGPCQNPVLDNLLLKLFKNKVDYCRIHNYDIIYNNVLLDPNMTGYWAKYPVIRSTMVARPEAEWIWWVDSHTVITDMDFSLPFEKYLQHNLVIHGKKNWTGFNTNVFLIRNCQWSMDLLDRWSMFSPISPEYNKWGSILKFDDKTALDYLLVKEGKKWRNKIYFENELDIVSNSDKNAERYRVSGLRRRFITHFMGCRSCDAKHNEMYSAEECWGEMNRALNFADNQVLRNFGYFRPDLSNSSFVKPISID